jgi:hypothetical protein
MLLPMLLSLAVQAGGAPADEALDFAALVGRTADLDWMLEAPRPGEGVFEHEWSTDDAGPDSHTLLLEGPGALSRLWLSSASGRLELEIDGVAVAVLPADLAAFAATADDARPDWQKAPLMQVLGHGFTSYLPLPFATSCALRWVDAPAGARMQASVRRFGDGVAVLGFTAEDLEQTASKRALRRSIRFLTGGENPAVPVMPAPFKVGAARLRSPEMPPTVTNGEFRWPIVGHGIMRWFELDFIHKEAPAPSEEMLRSLVLRVELGSGDIEEPGDVLFEVPLGDFFGSAPGANPWLSPWLGYDIDRGVFYCRLPIPYEYGMKICVASDMTGFARFRMRAGLDPIQDHDDLPDLRLHAGWVRGRNADGSQAARLSAEGPARLAALSFHATSAESEAFRHQGPFAFAGAWGMPTPGALAQVTLWEGPGAFGRSSMIRHYGLDAPTVAEGRLEALAGVVFPGDEPVDYGMFAWWYAPRLATSNLDPVEGLEERHPAPRPSAPFALVEGAFEAELAPQLRAARGSRLERIQTPWEQGFSRAQYVEWSGAAEGDLMALTFPVEEVGRYRLTMRLATGPGRGKVQPILDGRAIGEPVDLSAAADGLSEVIDLGSHRMMPRVDHGFALRTLDGKPVGFDYLLLELAAAPGAEGGDGSSPR